IYRGTSCKNGSACHRDENRIPSHLRHDCLPTHSIRKGALSRWDRVGSKRQEQRSGFDSGRTIRQYRLRPIGKLFDGRYRMENNSTRRRYSCNLLLLSPTTFPIHMAPIFATAEQGLSALLLVFFLPPSKLHFSCAYLAAPMRAVFSL